MQKKMDNSEGFLEQGWRDVVYILRMSLFCSVESRPEEVKVEAEAVPVSEASDGSGLAEVVAADLVRNGWTWDIFLEA